MTATQLALANSGGGTHIAQVALTGCACSR
jgi:hypothetical protein